MSGRQRSERLFKFRSVGKRMAKTVDHCLSHEKQAKVEVGVRPWIVRSQVLDTILGRLVTTGHGANPVTSRS